MIAAAVVLFALGNLYATLNRSTIPRSLHGTVVRLQVVHEKHPGLDDVHLLTLGERTIQVDPELAAHLRVGERVDKDAWSATLSTSSGSIHLSTSKDFHGMVVTMPVLLVVTLAALLWRPSREPVASAG